MKFGEWLTKYLTGGEIHLGGKFEVAHRGHTWEQTAAGVFLEPLVSFLVRTGELMLLAGAFQTAANITGMTSLKVLTAVMYFVLSSHLYMSFWRYIVMPLNRAVRIPATFVNLVLILIGSGATLFLVWWLIQQIIDASRHLVAVC